MNKQLRHISVAAMILLAVLIVSTTYWQTWAVGDLANRKGNETALIARITVDRGKLLAADGTVLANNRVTRKRGLTIYTRHYPLNDLAPQVLGYSTPGATTGLESAYDAYLTGSNTDLSNSLKHALQLGGATVHGDNVVLTLRPAVQRLALTELAGRCGAVVAMDAKTGAVYAMASSPTYNENLIAHHYPKIAKIKGTCGDASALQNNATVGLYPPGSTFKMVTAAAALDSGAYTPSSTFNDPGYCTEYGRRVSNAGNPDQSGPEAFGNVTLAQGFEHSINSVFCNVGMHIGGEKILEYAKRFGFYSVPPLDTPSNESLASGLYKNGKLWRPTSNSRSTRAGSRSGSGTCSRRRFRWRSSAPRSRTEASSRSRTSCRRSSLRAAGQLPRRRRRCSGRALKPSTAAELNQMMQLVVQGGTAAGIFPASLHVAGKTGTAELGLRTVYDAWFVCFAPATNPRYVVSVVVRSSRTASARLSRPRSRGRFSKSSWAADDDSPRPPKSS